MKKIINAIRDFLYNITDYGLIITVVVVMAAVLVWRFDILFSRNIEKEAIASIPTQYEQNTDTTNTDPSSDDSKKPANDNPVNEADNSDSTNKEPTKSDVIATVEIPQGSFPTKIGEILANSNIIEDKNAFLNRSVEMGLDTKLQSGTFEIAVGTSLDEVIKIIAHAN